MPTTQAEAADILTRVNRRLPLNTLEDMKDLFVELDETTGQQTDNSSLRDTLKMLRTQLCEALEGIAARKKQEEARLKLFSPAAPAAPAAMPESKLNLPGCQRLDPPHEDPAPLSASREDWKAEVRRLLKNRGCPEVIEKELAEVDSGDDGDEGEPLPGDPAWYSQFPAVEERPVWYEVAYVVLWVLIAAHMAVVLGNMVAACILPFIAPWYVAMPIMTFVISISLTPVDCKLTRWENQLRRYLQLPPIRTFIGHYLAKHLYRAWSWYTGKPERNGKAYRKSTH